MWVPDFTKREIMQRELTAKHSLEQSSSYTWVTDATKHSAMRIEKNGLNTL